MGSRAHLRATLPSINHMEFIMAQGNSTKPAKFLEVKTLAGGQLQFILGDGQRATFEAGRCTQEIQEQAKMHGFNQKVRDSAAGFSKEKDYDGAMSAMLEVVDALYAGNWNRTGGGASAGVVMADLATALATIKGASVAKAMAAVEAATPEQRAKWAKNPKVAALMAKAKADRLAAALNEAATDPELPDFGDDDEESDVGDDETGEIPE